MTIIENASSKVLGFKEFHQSVFRKMVINGLELSTQKNYCRSLASISLYFNQIPNTLSQEQIDEYLFFLKQGAPKPSIHSFKFTICALRFVIRNFDLPSFNIRFPSVKHDRKLPVVLNRQEITAMMKAPGKFKQRVMIALLYGCGLRCGEVRRVKTEDVDLVRALLFVRKAKGRKDRYVPLGETLLKILERYIAIERPGLWLFAGKETRPVLSRSIFDKAMGQRSVQYLVKRAAYWAGVSKQVNVHSLRHTYATHMLEDGVDILSISEFLGHANIKTTLIYLHVALLDNRKYRSPLDNLKNLNIAGYIQTKLDFSVNH